MANTVLSERTVDGRELEDRRCDCDFAEGDPVHRAARELVAALIASRWSLTAAVVVVALRRLCEAVTGTQASSWPPMVPFVEGVTRSNMVKAERNGDGGVPLASVIGTLDRPTASCG